MTRGNLWSDQRMVKGPVGSNSLSANKRKTFFGRIIFIFFYLHSLFGEANMAVNVREPSNHCLGTN